LREKNKKYVQVELGKLCSTQNILKGYVGSKNEIEGKKNRKKIEKTTKIKSENNETRSVFSDFIFVVLSIFSDFFPLLFLLWW